jgi:hypothetical protein
VHKHIAPAALRLDESIAFGRIKPLHSSGRHQSSPRGKRGRGPNLRIPVTAATKFVTSRMNWLRDSGEFARITKPCHRWPSGRRGYLRRPWNVLERRRRVRAR